MNVKPVFLYQQGKQFSFVDSDNSFKISGEHFLHMCVYVLLAVHNVTTTDMMHFRVYI